MTLAGEPIRDFHVPGCSFLEAGIEPVIERLQPALRFSRGGRNSMALSAGLRVSAFTDDRATEIAIVIANC